MNSPESLLREAVRLAYDNRARGGRPFGALLARGTRVLATGVNEVVHSHDPTTHAEMQALRAGTRAQANPRLDGCVVYASGHPCPMCLAALVMSGVASVYYAFDNGDAEPYGLSSAAAYAALRLPLSPPPLPLTRLDIGVTAEQLYGDAPLALSAMSGG